MLCPAVFPEKIGDGSKFRQIAPVPDSPTFAMALAGLGCGGSVVFRRRRAR